MGDGELREKREGQQTPLRRCNPQLAAKMGRRRFGQRCVARAYIFSAPPVRVIRFDLG